MWIKTQNGNYLRTEKISAIVFKTSYSQTSRALVPNVVEVIVDGYAIELGKFDTENEAKAYAAELFCKINAEAERHDNA